MISPVNIGSLLLKIVLKTFLLAGCALILPACMVLDQLAQPVEQASLQKRLTYPRSDVVAVGMVEQLIAKQESLLIAEQQDPEGWPLPAIDVVVMYEQQLCRQDKALRAELLARLKNAEDLPSRFQTLVLASCAPDFTPSVLARSLKQVRQARSWPASYEAYFDLQERHQQALVRLENLYGSLKEHMDTTIEKLTEIEVQTQP